MSGGHESPAARAPDTAEKADEVPPPARADARRNRMAILAAAESAFAEEGIGVPVDEIARRAGVGAGTLYRNFPTKEVLFEAVIRHHMEADHRLETPTHLPGCKTNTIRPPH